MKATDDYKAKLRFWAAHPRVEPLPELPRLPRFSPQRFRTHGEMNAWKRDLLKKLARGAATHG